MAHAPDDLTRLYPWLTDDLWHLVVRQSAAVGGGRLGTILQAIDQILTPSLPPPETLHAALAAVVADVPRDQP